MTWYFDRDNNILKCLKCDYCGKFISHTRPTSRKFSTVHIESTIVEYTAQGTNRHRCGDCHIKG